MGTKTVRVQIAGILLLTSLLACEKVFGTQPGDPGRVADLRVESTASSSITLAWTEVPDGGKKPAVYAVVVSPDSFSWPTDLAGATFVPGDSIGATIQFGVDDLNRGTKYFAQVAAARLEETGNFLYGTPSNLVSAVTESDPPTVVDDLRVSSVTSTSATLQWTQVDDGTGLAASYRLAFGSPSVNWGDASRARLVPGTSIGSTRTSTIEGLTSGTNYAFQLETIRAGASEGGSGAFSNTVAATPPIVSSVVEPFFSDNFDNGNRTTANGFTWSNTGSRSFVSSTKSFGGTHSLGLRFGPDSLGKDSSAEGRFSLGRNLTEVWIEFMLYVPANYTHRNESPNNNKFFRIWGDNYSSANKVGASTTRSGDASALSFEYNYKTWGDGTLGFGPSSVAGARSPTTTFGGPEFRDRWTRVRVHARHVSAENADDAILQLWFDDTMVLDFRNVPQKYDPLRPFWNAGYLLGWANSGFTDETIFYVDNVKFYNLNPGW